MKGWKWETAKWTLGITAVLGAYFGIIWLVTWAMIHGYLSPR